MSNWRRKQLAAAALLTFAIGVPVDASAVAAQSESDSPPTRLARAVSEQILSGRQSHCSRESMVFYEACLLYQGAFAYWSNVGFPDECGQAPALVGELPASVLAGKALGAASNACFASVYAVGVANTVPVLASTLNQLFPMLFKDGFENPASDAERCLQLRYGLCGNHAALAQGLLEEAGLTVRPVQFFYQVAGTRYSHIAPEVLIGGTYRFIDTTYGAYWISQRRANTFALATLEEILGKRKLARNAIWNTALAPYAIRRAVTDFDPFEYLTAPNVDVIRGNKGTIKLTLRGASGTERFVDLPAFIGDNQDDGQTSGLDFVIDGARGRYQVRLLILASAVTGFAPASVCIDNACQQVPTQAAELTFEVTDPRRLHVESAADAAYVIVESLSWKRLQ